MAVVESLSTTSTNVLLQRLPAYYKTTIGILDLTFLGYYKIKQGVLQQNLKKYCHFEEANKVCEELIIW